MEAQNNRSRGLEDESEDSRPGRPRSFAHNFGMHRVRMTIAGGKRPMAVERRFGRIA
jgi:hypothetical protein